jgi:hypothetical protein
MDDVTLDVGQRTGATTSSLATGFNEDAGCKERCKGCRARMHAYASV